MFARLQHAILPSELKKLILRMTAPTLGEESVPSARRTETGPVLELPTSCPRRVLHNPGLVFEPTKRKLVF